MLSENYAVADRGDSNLSGHLMILISETGIILKFSQTINNRFSLRLFRVEII
ncbi:hypothetical protein [Emticicia agri]|uniref:hypothetical protein n=1 Tax=Emticicia agri TaxID=2492393 RepID=UPI0013EB994D|nr:hypothetical protein [Emticicia agri]